MPGRRPKPTKLKVLEGNPGHRTIKKTEPEPERGIPVMPEWLRTFPLAVEAWERDAEILDGMGVMTEADGAALAQRCYLEARIIKLALDIEKEGDVQYNIRMDPLGNEIVDSKANPKAVQLKNLITEYRQGGSSFGFDPSSRSKLTVTDKSKKSKFDGLVGVKGGKK